MTSTEVLRRKIAVKESMILLLKAEIDDLEAEIVEREIERTRRNVGIGGPR